MAPRPCASGWSPAARCSRRRGSRASNRRRRPAARRRRPPATRPSAPATIAGSIAGCRPERSRAGHAAKQQIAHRELGAVHLPRRDAARHAADAALAVGHRQAEPVRARVDRHHAGEHRRARVAVLDRQLLQRRLRHDAAPVAIDQQHAGGVVERLFGQPLDFGGDQHADLGAARLLVGPRRDLDRQVVDRQRRLERARHGVHRRGRLARHRREEAAARSDRHPLADRLHRDAVAAAVAIFGPRFDAEQVEAVDRPRDPIERKFRAWC